MSSNICLTKVCEHCGNEFTAKTSVTRYCTHKCNQRAYKLGQAKNKIEKSNSELELIRASKNVALSEKAFLSVPEVCQLLGIGRTNFYALVKSGTVVPVKLGSRTIVARKQIDKLFK